MKKLLLNVDYTDNTGKYWQESYVKNMVVVQQEGEAINDTVRRVVEETDGVKFSYKGKPQSNIFRDVKNGEVKHSGYVYRVQTEIYNQSEGINGAKALFDAWIEISEVVPANIKLIEG